MIDARKFGLMRQIGVELEFSNACVLLGDKIHPEGGLIMSLYTAPQFASKDAAMGRKCRKLNNHIIYYTLNKSSKRSPRIFEILTKKNC